MKETTNLLALKELHRDLIHTGFAIDHEGLLRAEFASILFSKDQKLVEQFIKNFGLPIEIIKGVFTDNAFTLVQNNSNNPVLQYLIKENYISDEELSLIDDFNACLLHDAAYYGADTIVRTLLKNNVSSNIINNNGMTPLMCATMVGNDKIVKLLLPTMDQYHINFIMPLGYTFLNIAYVSGNGELLNSLKTHKSLKNANWDYNSYIQKKLCHEPLVKQDRYVECLNLGTSFLYKLAFSNGVAEQSKFKQAILNFNQMKDSILQNMNDTEESIKIAQIRIFYYTLKLETVFKLYYETNPQSPYHAKNILAQMIEDSQKASCHQILELSLHNKFFVIAQNNKDWDFAENIMEKAIQYANFDTIDGNDEQIFCLYYNYGSTLERLGKNNLALEYYYKAHAIKSNDPEVINSIFKIEINNRNYNAAFTITESFEDYVLSKISQLYLKIVFAVEDFNKLLADYDYNNFHIWAANYKDDFMYLDVSNIIEKKLGNYQKALENSESFLEMCTMPYDRDKILVRIFGELRLMEDKALAASIASKYENECLNTDQIAGFGFLLQQLACTIYVAAKDYGTATGIFKKYQNNLDLHGLYKFTIAAAMSDKDYDTALQHINFFLNVVVDPNLLAKITLDQLILKFIFIDPLDKLDSSSNKIIEQPTNKTKFDFELYDNAEDKGEIDFTEYSAREIHEYYQAQKKFLDKQQAASVYLNLQENTEKWFFSGVILDGNNSNIVQLSPNYYAVIDQSILGNPESVTTKQFNTALSKGYCKGAKGLNGVKVFLGHLFELKNNTEERLYTSEIFINENGKKLVIFNKYCANHKKMQKIIKDAHMEYIPCEHSDYDLDNDWSSNNNTDENYKVLAGESPPEDEGNE